MMDGTRKETAASISSAEPQPRVNTPTPRGADQLPPDCPQWATALVASMKTTIETTVEATLTKLLGVEMEAFSKIPSEVIAMKNDITGLHEELEEAKRGMEVMRKEMTMMTETTWKAVDLLGRMDSKMNDMESRQRRGNVRLFSVEEGLEGTERGGTIRLAEEILTVGLGLVGPLVDRAHRALGGRRTGNQPRCIVIKCCTEGAAEEIFNKAFANQGGKFEWKGKVVSIGRDYSGAVMYCRKEYGPIRDVLSDRGVRSSVMNDRLRVYYRKQDDTNQTEMVEYKDIYEASAGVKSKGFDVEVIRSPQSLAEEIDHLVWKFQKKPRQNQGEQTDQSAEEGTSGGPMTRGRTTGRHQRKVYAHKTPGRGRGK